MGETGKTKHSGGFSWDLSPSAIALALPSTTWEGNDFAARHHACLVLTRQLSNVSLKQLWYNQRCVHEYAPKLPFCDPLTTGLLGLLARIGNIGNRISCHELLAL